MSDALPKNGTGHACFALVRTGWIAIGLALLSGCAVSQQTVPAPMTVTEIDTDLYRLDESIEIKARNAQPTRLVAGTRWTRLGSIPQGNVFATSDQVVIVNGFDVHEAHIVTNDGQVVGFYLVVEKTFVEAKPVDIILTTEGEGT